jgi:hypothetical protein
MVSFFDQVIFNHSPSLNIGKSKSVVQPLLDAMEMEGSYNLKPPCYTKPLVNAQSPSCFHGTPWNAQYSQAIMGGNLPGTKMSVDNDDNHHEVQDTNPIHLPEIDTSCASDSKGCTIKTITVSEAIYGTLDSADTGYYPVSASEIKTKLTSRQNIQEHAGITNADFHTLDEEGNRCADINDASI